jgi:nucleoside 2-deoxyribosyltransferase
MSNLADDHVVRVYCAGPLFNQAERQEMKAIADALTEAGYAVYLPHRDGMEFRLILNILVERGWPAPQAAHFLHAAIFALDVYQLAVECDAMVWNLNGRTPDEGAVSEAAIAWTLGKPLIAYKDDVRTLIAGRSNPLLVGLVDFETVDEIPEIPEALASAMLKHADAPPDSESMPAKLRRAVEDGRKLWESMVERDAHCHDRLIADVVTELFAPSQEVF